MLKNLDIQNKMTRNAGPLLKIFKSVYHSSQWSEDVTLDEVKKHRNFVESIAHIAFTRTRITRKKINIDSMDAKWFRSFYESRDPKVILYCHGGGYTCGGLEYSGILGTKLAAHTGFPVFAFAYRLAPENRYPAALEDAISAWEYLVSKKINASDIIVAGDSAGGNLALELCLHLKKRGAPMPCALLLYSPWTDMSAKSSTYVTEADNDPFITKTYVLNSRKAYLGEDVTDYNNPDYSPLYANLTGMPPTLIQVGTNEVLRRDSELLAVKLKKSAVRVKLQIYGGGWHVFQQFPTAMAKRAMTETHLFLLSVIYGRKPVKTSKRE